MTDGTFGPCCTGGDCCGPGSYCCANTGPHNHDEEFPAVTICPACEGSGAVAIPESAHHAYAPCTACGGRGDTADPLEIINTTPPPGVCICSKTMGIGEDGNWWATFALDPNCPEHGPEFKRLHLDKWVGGMSIDKDENNG